MGSLGAASLLLATTQDRSHFPRKALQCLNRQHRVASLCLVGAPPHTLHQVLSKPPSFVKMFSLFRANARLGRIAAASAGTQEAYRRHA